MTQEKLLYVMEMVKEEGWTTWHFSNQGLTSFPEKIRELVNLKVLNLSSNHLTVLPDFIGNLQKLQKLDLSSSHLTVLPESIGNLKNLQTLHLNNNQLKTLPNSIGNLKNLQTLYLNNNQLKTLPNSIGNLKNLQTLCLDRNQLTVLPDSIDNLKNLEILVLGNNQLTVLPDSIGNLKKLEILDLETNPLITLPLEILSLPKLKINDKMLELIRETSKLKAEEKAKFKVGILELPKVLRIAFLNYLNHFKEYISLAKGKEVNFAAKEHIKGLELAIEITPNITIQEINVYLETYLNYLDKKVLNISNDVITPQLLNQIDLLKLKLEHQKATFWQDFKILEVEKKTLERNHETYKHFSKKELKGKNKEVKKLEKRLKELEVVNNKVSLNLSKRNISFQNNHQTNTKVTQSTNIHNNIKVEQAQTDFEALIDALKAVNLLNPAEQERADALQKELDEAQSMADLAQNRGFKSRFNRLLKGVLGKVTTGHTALVKAPQLWEKIKTLATGLNLPEVTAEIAKYISSM